MRLGRFLLLSWFILASMLSGADPWANSGQEILAVTCSEPEGCFRLIEQAIADAQPGTIIRIRPGLYYEKPLIIEKSLTLERSGSSGMAEIRFVDPESGLTIRSTDEPRSIKVIIRDLRLVTPGLSRAGPSATDRLPFAILIEGTSTSADDLRVFIERTAIYGHAGIAISKAHLILQESTIAVDAWSINASFSKLELVNSALAGAGFHSGFNISLANTEEAIVQNNRIWVLRPLGAVEGRRWAVSISGIGKLGEARAALVGNEIRGADTGAIVSGKTTVEFSQNRFIDNAHYGIMLLLPPCAKQEGEGLFQGEIRGVENEFQGNGQDFCPLDYPWPKGFIKTP